MGGKFGVGSEGVLIQKSHKNQEKTQSRNMRGNDKDKVKNGAEVKR